MSQPFADHARSYIERGFSPIPIVPGTKRPHPRDWTIACISPESPDDIERINFRWPRAGLAVACGYKGLVAIDVDQDAAIPVFKEVMGDFTSAKKGQRGFTAFYQDPTGKINNRTFRDTTDHTLLEVLSLGRCTLIPPTIHPDTQRPYEHLGTPLQDLTPTDLPVITQANVDDIEAALAPLMKPPRVFDSAPASTTGIRDLSPFLRARHFDYCIVVLNSEVKQLQSKGKPGRNVKLFKAVCNVGAWVHAGFLDEDRITTEFMAACTANGLVHDNGRDDVIDTIKDALRYSKNDPLRVLNDRRQKSRKT